MYALGRKGARLSHEGLVGQGRNPAPTRGNQMVIRLPRTCLEVQSVREGLIRSIKLP